MEGTSSGLAGHLDGILPKDVQFVLDWNPPQLLTKAMAEVIFPTQEPPDTTLLKFQSTTIGSSRQAAFYDKHLAPHLILERVVYFDKLVSTMANTVDQAIEDAVAKRPLPKDTGPLMTETIIKYQVMNSLVSPMYRELDIAEAYTMHAGMYCAPLASTLAIHPSSEHWGSILRWTIAGQAGRWAIADGVLIISPAVFANYKWKELLLQNEDDGKIGILQQLAFHSTPLAIWEMKSLTVGTAQVMEEIAEMGLTHAKFLWKKCTRPNCGHQSWERMEESRESYDAGVEPRSPPWTLPIVPSTSATDSRPTSLRKGLRSASAQGGMTAGLSYKEPSLSPVEDGEGVRKKRRRNGSDASEYERPPSKKPKADSRDASYEPPPGARKEVNAQSFLQQVT
jgi:hypothetical protein